MTIFNRLPDPKRDPSEPITYRDVQKMRQIFVEVAGVFTMIETQFGLMQEVLRRPIPPGLTIPSEDVAAMHADLVQAIDGMRQMVGIGQNNFAGVIERMTAMEGRN